MTHSIGRTVLGVIAIMLALSVSVAMAAGSVPAAVCGNGLHVGNPHCQQKKTPPAKPVPHYVAIDATADAVVNASLYATTGAATATAGASTSSGGGATISQGRSYALAAAPSAAPLPAGTCPQGDSLAWSIGWGFFTYSDSRTRTEMECLDTLLAFARETQPKAVEMKMAPTADIHPPVAPSAACIASAPPARVVKRKPATKTGEYEPVVAGASRACAPT